MQFIDLDLLPGVDEEAGRTKLEEAEVLQRSVMDSRIRVLGPSHLDTLQTMSDLAASLFHQEKDADAIKLQREVLRLRRTKLADTHEDIHSSMDNLCRMLELSPEPTLQQEAAALKAELQLLRSA